MNITDKNIDNGKPFDWGKTSSDYAKFRDIYPQVFYDKIIGRGLCIDGQSVLDLGTGTGVLPRNMYRYGAKWTGIDISEEQIQQARLLSKGMDIVYCTSSAENAVFSDNTFDVITACQCFWYFDHKRVAPKMADMLKENGKLLILYMAWLPYEDQIAEASEKLVLEYSPNWSGAGETKHPIAVPDCVHAFFETSYHEEYEVEIPFTRETWNGRIKACRGVGASLSEKEVAEWEKGHRRLLERIAPEKFSIKHYIAMLEMQRKR